MRGVLESRSSAAFVGGDLRLRLRGRLGGGASSLERTSLSVKFAVNWVWAVKECRRVPIWHLQAAERVQFAEQHG